MTILLVDDNDGDRALFCEAANELDETIHCTEAGSGLKALSYLRDRNNLIPDFIFLELRMSGLSGQACLREIKNDPRLAIIPVIVYTSSSSVHDSIEMKRLGAVYFMTKPVSPDEIFYMLSFALGGK